jgi:hypothetical protein
MEEEIEKDKLIALGTLQRGLADACADDLTVGLINLAGGTCDYTELIPVLEEIARVDWFYYFDDNGAGGLPRADLTRNSSFKSWALSAIQSIKENARFESNSMVARALKSNSISLIQNTLQHLKSEGTCRDTSLIPILEKIARYNVYSSYSYYTGFKKECQLGELARTVIQQILQQPTSLDKADGPTLDQNQFT